MLCFEPSENTLQVAVGLQNTEECIHLKWMKNKDIHF